MIFQTMQFLANERLPELPLDPPSYWEEPEDDDNEADPEEDLLQDTAVTVPLLL